MQVDYLIVGQGICGTTLSWNFIEAGLSFVVIDGPNPSSSSRVAAGLINPIAGKRYVKSWLYDTMLPAALETYARIGSGLGSDLVKQLNLLQFHTTPAERQAFMEKMPELPDYLAEVDHTHLQASFSHLFGTGSISSCHVIDSGTLLDKWRANLKSKDLLIDDHFEVSQLSISGASITYQDISAKKVIFCDGANAAASPYFSLLPFSLNKGEALVVRIPDLSPDHIYKHQLKLIPIEGDLFWFGASFEWKYPDVGPTEAFRQKAEHILLHWLKLPYTIEAHFAGERPSTVDYRPFAGFHPHIPGVGIFNGMGTKGYLQAPYFARQITDHLVNATPIMPEVSVNRYQNVLSRGVSS